MYRKVIAIIAVLIMLSQVVVSAGIDGADIIQVGEEQERAANILKDLGLFAGTNNGFELDKVPDRTQAAVMVVRMLGKEQYAKEAKLEHPFKDVPAWADDYIGYMYQNKLTSGVSATLYGANEYITADQYTTFLLRVLGYSDAAGDFSYMNAVDYAVEIGMLQENTAGNLKNQKFSRGCMVEISYASLNAELKDGETKLINKLISDGAVSPGKALNAGFNVSIEVPSFDTGFTVIRWLGAPNTPNDPSAYMYIEKSKLPEELRERAQYFWYDTVPSDMSYEEMVERYVQFGSIWGPEEIGKRIQQLDDDIIPGSHPSSIGITKPVIVLYDKNANVIAIRTITRKDFVNSDSHYIQFMVSFVSDELIPGGFTAFELKRYINGVEDPTFTGVIEGSNPRGGRTRPDGKHDYKYISAPIFIKDSSVTYEYIDLEPEVEKSIVKATYDWNRVKAFNPLLPGID